MKKILLIEDDAFLAQIYRDKLELEGFEVMVTNNGEDGLKLAAKDHPDLVLLDLVLPRANGFEILEQLRADEAAKSVPVLVLSNLGQKEDVQRAFALGAKGYIIKSHALPDETLQKIKEVI